MNWHAAALILAGIIGSAVAVVHGALTQRLMVTPFQRLAKGRMAPSVVRLAPMLLQFSTFNWLIGGLALILAAVAFDRQARLATTALVGAAYLFGAIGNAWGTRGRHPGWMLLAAALAFMVYGAAG